MAANDHDQETVASKYLHSDPSSFLPPPFLGPDDTHRAPPGMIAGMRSVFSASAPPPKKSSICFSTDIASLERNSEILRQFDYDLQRLINKESNTTLGYGSEFRPIHQLTEVVGLHPNFPELKKVLAK